MKMRGVPTSQIVFDPSYYHPKPLTEVDVLHGDKIWDEFFASFTSAQRSAFEKMEQKERETLRGWCLAVITGRDAYSPVSREHSAWVAAWAESAVPGIGKCAFDWVINDG
jgi:hypothetical protein